MAALFDGKQNCMLVLIPLFLQLVGLLVSAVMDTFLTVRQRRTMLAILILEVVLVLQNIADYSMSLDRTYMFSRVIVGIIGYSVRPIILLLFIYLLEENRKQIFEWVLAIVNAGIYATAVFSGIAFGYTESNRFARGPLGYTCHIVSAILLAEVFYLSVKKYAKRKELSKAWVPLINVAVIVAAVWADDAFQGDFVVTHLTIAIISVSLFYYLWLHIQHEKEKEEEIKAEQRIQLMMSQIQPHFLYNTLSTIQSLCRTNPDKAGEVTENFGTYLRQNLDSLGQTNLVPLTKALEHTKVYADIESVRFPKIKVEYDIKDRDFSIPALTIQPLVENAIRHGVRGMDDGLVTVSTRRTEDGHEIIVRDNGKGFDVEHMKEGGRSHIGLKNVKERVEKMCNGTMDIDSNIDEGTTITIRIPAVSTGE